MSTDAVRNYMLSVSAAVANSIDHIMESIKPALYNILVCQGTVYTSGVGRAGLIASKISETLRSTGTKSHFLHAAEAMHGDIGNISDDDIVIIFSNSGETPEIIELLKHIPATTIAITGTTTNTLASTATFTVSYGKVKEDYPTLSTSMMLVVGDAIAIYLAEVKGFTKNDFLNNHPGGNIGLLLSSVNDKMRPLSKCHIINQNMTIKDAYLNHKAESRRSGVMLIIDDGGILSGLFTDSDLARILERSDYKLLDLAIQHTMTTQPITVSSGTKLHDAITLMSDNKISEVPVIDDSGKPIGLLDITDLI